MQPHLYKRLGTCFLVPYIHKPLAQTKALDLNLFRRVSKVFLSFKITIVAFLIVLGPYGVPKPMVDVWSKVWQCNMKFSKT